MTNLTDYAAFKRVVVQFFTSTAASAQPVPVRVNSSCHNPPDRRRNLSSRALKQRTRSFSGPWCWAVVLAGAALFSALLPAAAQTVTFDFDAGTPALTVGQNVPFDQCSGGLTAHFNASAGGFSAQNYSGTFLTLSQFSGNYLYPNVDSSIAVIQFSQQITNLVMDFATAEQTPIENPTPIRLLAYTNSASTPPVGSAVVAGTYFGVNTLPMGKLTFNSATPFNVVTVNIEPGGATGFLLDNIAVEVSGGDHYAVVTSASPPAGGTTSGDGSYLSGAPVSVVATPNSGYDFVNWTENAVEVSTAATYDFTATAFRSLVANFVKTWTIATSATPAEGGTTSGDGIYPDGSAINVVAAPNPGYAFVNWTENGVPVSSWLSTMVTLTNNRALVANFAAACTITTSSSSAAAGSTAGDGAYPIGSTVTVVATPKTGYTFENWTDNGVPVSTSLAYSFSGSGDRTLVAHFIGDAAGVTFDFDAGTPALTNGQTTAFDQTSGGLTAHFSATNDPAFSVQSDAATGWVLSRFSGKYLAPIAAGSALAIQFSQVVTNVTLSFATLDFQEVVTPSTVQLAGYDTNGAVVRTATAQGAYRPGDSMTIGSITLSSGTPMQIVRVTASSVPQGAIDFIIDNLFVSTVPQPIPQPSLSLFLTTTNTAVISWPAPSTGYVLQENAALGDAGWTETTATVQVVGGENQAIVPAVSGNRFYRLFRQ